MILARALHGAGCIVSRCSQGCDPRTLSAAPDRPSPMTTLKKGMPKVSPFAQMLREKREKLAPGATLREFCAARGFEAPVIDGMERDRRTAPGTYSALYKLASGYGHAPTDRWTAQLLDAALGRAPVAPRPAKPARAARKPGPANPRQASAKPRPSTRRAATTPTRAARTTRTSRKG